MRRHLCAGVVSGPEVPCAVCTYKRPRCGRTTRMFGARGASRFALLCTHFLALLQLLGPCQSLLGLALGWWLWDQGCSLHSPDELLHTIPQAGRRERFHLDTTMGVVEIQLMLPGLVIPNPLPLLPSQHQVGDRVGLRYLCTEAGACCPKSQQWEERLGEQEVFPVITGPVIEQVRPHLKLNMETPFTVRSRVLLFHPSFPACVLL